MDLRYSLFHVHLEVEHDVLKESMVVLQQLGEEMYLDMKDLDIQDISP